MPLQMLALFGPVSSASPNGQGPLFSWFLILVGGFVVITAWRHYLKRRREVQISFLNILGISGISVVLIVVGIWSLFRSQ
jgi:predicted lysophospholipase L1 biosynthesis ABC-type transport system permease subunit